MDSTIKPTYVLNQVRSMFYFFLQWKSNILEWDGVFNYEKLHDSSRNLDRKREGIIH